MKNITRRTLFLFLLFLLFNNIVLPQGSVMLVGGGTENYGDWSDMPYKWFIEHAPNRKILILHYADTTNWFSKYLPSLSPCTVSNLFISSISQANDSATYKLILQFDGIFLRGGDQSKYVSIWKNTLTQKAIKEIFLRGGIIGGTSAGEMVLSNVSYIAGNSDLGALLKLPGSSITLEDNFLPFVSDALAESHSNERGRIGRLPVFLAKYKNLTNKEIQGIAIDANTALVIGSDNIGEVMGASAVTILRWNSATKFSIEANKAFSMQNLSFDQLLPGYKINLQTGGIINASSAASYSPKQFVSPKGTIILDGSGDVSDWSAPSGSIKRLQSLMQNSNDLVGIISSPSSSAIANSIINTLGSLGISSKVLLLNENNKNDLTIRSDISSCNAFILAGNNPDSLAGFLDSSSAVGKIFLSKISEEKPILFLSDDVMFAGEKVIGGIYSNFYNAYYGTLYQAPGLKLVRGIQLISRFYQNPNNTKSYDYSENRIMGMLWSMCKLQSSYGLIIDAGSYVTITNGKIEAGGISTTSSPVLLLDASKAKWFDFPTFHRPGKPNPVQNAALIGAYLNVIRVGDSNPLRFETEKEKEAPNNISLLPNYPNPFNSSTNISYSIGSSGKVILKIFDALGREVKTLIDRELSSGKYETTWDASNNSSDIYVARLYFFGKRSNSIDSKKLILLK